MNGNGAPSFDEIIQADRQRKRNETLAAEVFGKSGKTGPPSKDGRRTATTGSLASRVGVAKAYQRSSSNTPRPQNTPTAPRSHNERDVEARTSRVNRSAAENPMARAYKKDLLFEAATARTHIGPEVAFNIRGAAGPYTVVGSNFAPGTTSADIEHALQPIGGNMHSCRIITASPTVMAEMVYEQKSSADLIISTFNNKKADGRTLHLYLKQGPPSTASTAPAAVKPNSNPSQGDRESSFTAPANRKDQSDHRGRHAEPEYQDGSYGFESTNNDNDMDVDMGAQVAAVAAVEPLVAPAPASAPPSAPRARSPAGSRRDGRGYNHRDDRYSYSRGYERSRYDDRDRNYGPPRDDRRMYSDSMYQRPRGPYR